MEMVKLIENLLGKKAIKNFVEMQTGDVLTTYADITHSHQKLGFSPKTSIAQGLTKFIDWYQQFTTSCK